MTELFQIEAEKRTLIGKGNLELTERKIPGIIYGEKQDPILTTVEQKIKDGYRKCWFLSKQWN